MPTHCLWSCIPRCRSVAGAYIRSYEGLRGPWAVTSCDDGAAFIVVNWESQSAVKLSRDSGDCVGSYGGLPRLVCVALADAFEDQPIVIDDNHRHESFLCAFTALYTLGIVTCV